MTTIFVDAEKAVGGDRMHDYGDPRINHARTAVLWNAYVTAKDMDGEWDGRLDAVDVCYLNKLQKMARDMHSPKRDNLVDDVGYTRNIEMIRNEPGEDSFA